MGYITELYFIKKEEINKLKKLNWEDNWDEIDNILEKYPSLELGKMYYGEQAEFIDKVLQNSTVIIPHDDITFRLINDDFDILTEYQNMCIKIYNDYYKEEVKDDESLLYIAKQDKLKDLYSLKQNKFGYPTYKERWHQCEIFKQFLSLNDYYIVLYGS